MGRKGPRPAGDWRTESFCAAVEGGALDEALERYWDWSGERTYDVRRKELLAAVFEFALGLTGRSLASLDLAADWVIACGRSRSAEVAPQRPQFRFRWSDR